MLKLKNVDPVNNLEHGNGCVFGHPVSALVSTRVPRYFVDRYIEQKH